MATSGGTPIPSTSPGELKDLLIPENLVSTFLQLSKNNSGDGNETLGTFGGQLCSDYKYRVTHLLIPLVDCSLTDFHPHCAEPPLWTEADHVKTEVGSRVILKDLRFR